jgi:hypothetical protein
MVIVVAILSDSHLTQLTRCIEQDRGASQAYQLVQFHNRGVIGRSPNVHRAKISQLTVPGRHSSANYVAFRHEGFDARERGFPLDDVSRVLCIAVP